MQEIETEYLQNAIADKDRTALKIEIVVNDEFRITETIAMLQELEHDVKETEFFVYCPNLFNQIKIDEPDPNHNSLAVAAGIVIHSMHLDTLPYSSVIVTAPKGAEEKIKEICQKHGSSFEVIEGL